MPGAGLFLGHTHTHTQKKRRRGGERERETEEWVALAKKIASTFVKQGVWINQCGSTWILTFLLTADIYLEQLFIMVKFKGFYCGTPIHITVTVIIVITAMTASIVFSWREYMCVIRAERVLETYSAGETTAETEVSTCQVFLFLSVCDSVTTVEDARSYTIVYVLLLRSKWRLSLKMGPSKGHQK